MVIVHIKEVILQLAMSKATLDIGLKTLGRNHKNNEIPEAH